MHKREEVTFSDFLWLKEKDIGFPLIPLMLKMAGDVGKKV